MDYRKLKTLREEAYDIFLECREYEVERAELAGYLHNGVLRSVYNHAFAAGVVAARRLDKQIGGLNGH